jgi:hypothetical protein
MSRLESILNDVLAGRQDLKEPSSFLLLSEYAPGSKDELDRLEEEARNREEREVMGKVKPQSQDSIRLTRHDLDAILHERRITTIEEVEWLLAHGGDHGLHLSEVEELELRHVAARLLASSHIADARMKDHNEEFIAKTVGTFATQYGDLSESEVARLEMIRTEAVQAIQRCKDHSSRRCLCWRSTREALFNLRTETGGGSPVAMAALAVWNSVEAFARDRPQQNIIDQTEAPPGIVYNWRHFKGDREYIQSRLQEGRI